MSVNDILRFDIPDTSIQFNEYLLEQFSAGRFTYDIFNEIADDLLDIDLGISKTDSRIVDEFKSFQNNGYGCVEFAFIVLKACYSVGSEYHGI